MNTSKPEIVIFDSKLKEERDYWLRRLSQNAGTSNLPIDYVRPEVFSGQSDSVDVSLPDEIYHPLTHLTGGSSFLLYTALLAVLKICLFKYNGDERVVVGSPARRKNDSLQSTVNALPIITSLQHRMTFRQLLLHVREMLLEAYARQRYPYQRLISDLGLAKESNKCQLFDIALVLRESHYDLPDVRNDITIIFTEEGGRIDGKFVFNSQVFKRETIERLTEHFQKVLSEALSNPDIEIADIRMQTEKERRQIEEVWNDTGLDYLQPLHVPQLFEAQVGKTPQSIALVAGDEQLTYEQLNTQANRVAHRLISLGVGPDVLVGIRMQRSVEMVVALLAVLKAGGCYVPFDPCYPEDYATFMFEETQIKVMLTQQRLAEGYSAPGVQVLCLDVEQDPVGEGGEQNPRVTAADENLAYVIYTSGSTGRPKASAITHAGIRNRLLWMQQTYQLSGDDRVLQKTPYSFDVSVWEFFWPLITGARLVMSKPEGHKDTAYLVRIINEQEISTIHFVPSMLQLFLGEKEVDKCLSLKRVICSGEAIPPELPQRFYERLNAGLHNLYGPTEASVDVTFWPCERERVARSVPIGRPITNIQVYLLDSKLNGVAVGVAGELHIGGIGLARGYLKQPALTAERFIPNPFSRQPGGRLYKTGDLARYFPDGTIEFLGRIDHQVKVHGFRIELGEVESVLSQHPAIQEVVVQPKGNENGEKRLVAYFVSRDERGDAVDEPLRYKLPNNMEVACRNENEVEFLYREIFVRQSYMKHGIKLNDGDCVFDVGANVGLFTLFMNEVCREVKVYAFEPIPPIYELLRRNVEHYAPTARVFNCGLSNASRRAAFTYYPKSSIMSGYYADAVQDREVVTSFTLNEQQKWIDARDSPQQLVDEVLDGRFDSEQFDCHLRTLSSIISEHRIERIDLLKIDVEKSEADVLDGIEEAHWPLIRQVVVEVHDLDGRLCDIIQLLKAKGYEVEVEQESWLKGTVIYDVYATRPSSNNHDGLSQPLKIRDHLSRSFSDNSSYVEELRSFTRRRLPAYMVPSTFIRLDNLPLSSNGKIDRKALPDPDTHRPELAATYVLPKTEMEQAIAALWQEVLKMDKVGIYDNFFDLGGYSLIMGMVRRKLEALLNVEIAMVEMFEHPTVHSLAKHLSQPQSGTPTLQPDHDRARKQREAVRMRRQLREGETQA